MSLQILLRRSKELDRQPRLIKVTDEGAHPHNRMDVARVRE